MQYTCSIEAFNRSRSHRVNACMVTTPGHALHRSPDADSANPTNQEAVYGLVVVYGIKIMRSPYTYTDEKMVVYGLMQAPLVRASLGPETVPFRNNKGMDGSLEKRVPL